MRMALTEVEKSNVTRLAGSAMRELIEMAKVGPPLWLRGLEDGDTEILNEEVYFQMFPEIGPKLPGLTSEASRESVVVFSKPDDIVKILMDVRQWRTVFYELILNASTLEVISAGAVDIFYGPLQMMSAEFVVPSPLVPARACDFVRYSQQQSDGSWAVVDISTDTIRPTPVLTCRRRPSGCLIQAMPSGYSKVTWVEHVEADDLKVSELYKLLVRTTLAFGAKRWIGILDRHCQRFTRYVATNILVGDRGATNVEGRKSLFKLAERMVIKFCASVSDCSPGETWTTSAGSFIEDIKVRVTRSSDDPGCPTGIILSIATSFWLPPSPQRVFSFLQDATTRNRWDALSEGATGEEVAYIQTGRDPGNRISLIQSTHSIRGYKVILQESCISSSGCLIVYSSVNTGELNIVMNGGNPEYVAILPCGFAIFPDGVHAGGSGEDGGTLLTLAFQIVAEKVPIASLTRTSFVSAKNHMIQIVDKMKAVFTREFSNAPTNKP